MIISISGRINSGKDLIGQIIQYLTAVDSFTISTNIKNEIIPVITDKDSGINYYRDTKTFEKYLKDLKVKGNISFTKWQIKKFADKLKDIVCLVIGCTREQLEDETFKNTKLGEEWWYFKGRNGSLIPYTKNSKRSDEDLVKLTPRLLLQLLGTECGRNIIHPNIWINSLFSSYKEHINGDYIPEINEGLPNWIITDCRFPNELESVKEKGGISIRVNRDKEKDCNFCGKTIREQKKGCNEISCYRQFLKKEEHLSETALDNAEFDYTIDNNGTIEELVEKVKIILQKEKII